MIIDYAFKKDKVGFYAGRVSFFKDLLERFNISTDKNIISIDLSHDYLSIDKSFETKLIQFLKTIKLIPGYSVVVTSYPLLDSKLLLILNHWAKANNIIVNWVSRGKVILSLPNINVITLNSFTTIIAEVYHEVDFSNSIFANKFTSLSFCDKHFISANYQPKPHRSLIFCLMSAKNLLSKGYVSVNQATGEDYPTFVFDLEYDDSLHSIMSEKFFNLSIRSQRFLDFEPNHSVKGNWRWHRENKFIRLNNLAAVTLVTEATFDNRCFLTEKTMLPLMLKRPFLMCGGVGYLAHLKEQGYKTFDCLWDESYDSEPDLYKRYIKVSEILEDLCSMSLPDLTKKCDSIQNILDHNYNTFVNFDHKKHVLDFIEKL